MKIIDDPTGGREVIVNTAGAVVPQHAEVALLAYADDDSDGGAAMIVGLELEGPRNDHDVTSRSDELYLLDVDMTARLVSLLIGIVGQHAGVDVKAAFFDGIEARLAVLRAAAQDGAAE